jgi:hypothetical protein
MRKAVVIGGAVLLVAAIAAAIVPMWIATSGLGLSGAALAAVVFMVIGCFALGGGLMFLIFYSARKGYDDRVHHGAPRVGDDPPTSS